MVSAVILLVFGVSENPLSVVRLRLFLFTNSVADEVFWQNLVAAKNNVLRCSFFSDFPEGVVV